MGQIKRIVPLSAFRNDLDTFIGELLVSPEPIMVTRHGRGAFVVQGLASYAETSDLADMTRHQLWAEEQSRDKSE